MRVVGHVHPLGGMALLFAPAAKDGNEGIQAERRRRIAADSDLKPLQVLDQIRNAEPS